MKIKRIPPNMDGQICDVDDIVAVLEPLIQQLDRSLTDMSEWGKGKNGGGNNTRGALTIIAERAAAARRLTADAAYRRLYDIRNRTYSFTSQAWYDAFLIGADACSPTTLNETPSFPGTIEVGQEMVRVMYEEEMSESDIQELGKSLYHFTQGYFTDWEQEEEVEEELEVELAVAA